MVWIIVNSVIYNSDKITFRESNYYLAAIILTSVVFIGKLLAIAGMLTCSKRGRSLMDFDAMKEEIKSIKF